MEHSSFDLKSVDLIQPSCRTDVCDQCNEADQIFLRMQRGKIQFSDLLQIDQTKLIDWTLHMNRATHLRDYHQFRNFALSQGDYTFLIDYKENFKAPTQIIQASHAFYVQRPISCLSSISYKMNRVGQILKQITTILSPVISHTGSFTLKCVAQMFKNDFFSNIEKCYWFSDGGPHFRNQQLVCALLRDTQPLIPNVKFQINYSEPAHGKDEIDALFGNYQTELNENLLEEGISSLIALQESLSQMTFIISLQKEDHLCRHEVIIYDIPCVEDKIDIIRIPGFKQYLSFSREENSIVASHLSNEENAEDTKIKIVIIQKDSTKALKRSTVQIEEDDD
ncbi:MAG: hypothetical protein EZS28_016573 [Streblomastix strix]|uniref:Uncharacterized protein n=1 Tax=Streblomastix strix TaxID=222440 RepID=A0A5J4VZR6_9EUKA|nr:MAG: hypothetical protein EZS28_016573 [Streblomastix strix]